MGEPDFDERFEVEGDPPEALPALLKVDAEPIDIQAKDDRLTRLRKASDEELAVFIDSLREEAAKAGATEQEIHGAEKRS